MLSTFISNRPIYTGGSLTEYTSYYGNLMYFIACANVEFKVQKHVTNWKTGTFHNFYRPRRPLGRGEVYLALLFLDLGTRRGQRHAQAAFYPRERPGTDCTGGWVAPGPVWTGAENLAPTRIRSAERPFRSQSLYRKSDPAHENWYITL
jgi:hypothetical protein